MASYGMINIPSFMKIHAGVQAILGFCLRNLRGCNVGINYGRDLRIKPLRWGSGTVIYLPSSIKIGSGIQNLIGGYTYKHRHTDRKVIS
jgi:hypothetical protein